MGVDAEIAASGHEEILTRLGVDRKEIREFAQRDPKFSIMSRAHLTDLRKNGWSIGSHAMTHRTLSMLEPKALAAEIGDASAYFETNFGRTDLPFAYPYGDVVHVGSEAPLAVANAGHPIAFTTVPGPSDFANAPHLLPRIDYKRFLRDYAISVPEWG